MMADKHYVIIGNGPAGREAALTLRKQDPAVRITVVNREGHRYYQPHRLPAYLAGKIGLKDIQSEPFSFYEERGIKLRLHQKVVALDPAARRITLGHQETLRFDGLIIAVGGRPRIPEPMLRFRQYLLTLKTLTDAEKWKRRLEAVDKVLIVGGDLTSFAVTKALLSLGKEVAFIFTAEALWPMRNAEEIMAAAAKTLTDNGVLVMEGRLTDIQPGPDGGLLASTDRESAEAGLVGAFFGLVPDIGFLAGSGLCLERGILVDERLYAGFEGVYAAGDCAQVYHPELCDYWVSIGHDNAVALGRAAALNLAGGLERARVEPADIFCDQGVRANTSWWMEF